MDASQFRKAAHAAVEDVISYFSSLSCPATRVTPSIKPGWLRPTLPAKAPDKGEEFAQILADVDAKIKPGLTHWQSPRFMAFFPAFTTFPSILGELYSAAFSAPGFNWICSPVCTELETVMLDWVCKALGLPDCYLSDSPNLGGGVIQGSASEAVVVCMIAARERAVRSVLVAEGLLDSQSQDLGAASPGAAADTDALRLRAREDRAAEIRSKLVALGSDQTHSCTQKAAMVCGVRFRTVATTRADGFSMRTANIVAQFQQLRADGLIPFFLTATLGTTGTCAVDDMAGIAAQIKAPGAEWAGVWVHVDAAYAGAALVCEEHRSLAQADAYQHFESFDFNMHKWMLVNFDASCLFVRDRRDLLNALSITPSYLRTEYSAAGLVTDYRDWQIPLGRRFRALKIWFVLRAYGLDAIRDMVRRHVRLGEYFAGLVTGSAASGPGEVRVVQGPAGSGRSARLELLAGPAFALNVVRCLVTTSSSSGGAAGVTGLGVANGAGASVGAAVAEAGRGEAGVADEAASNALTQAVYERINASGDFFLTSAVVGGMYAIRVVSANERANAAHLRRIYELLHETMQACIGEL